MLNSGGFFFQNNIPPAGSLGPGALVNGLHVDAGKGKLGGPLIENTDIDTTGFIYTLTGANGTAFYLDDNALAKQIFLGEQYSTYALALDEADQLIYLGPYNGPFGDWPYIYVDLAINQMQVGINNAGVGGNNTLVQYDGGTGNQTIIANDNHIFLDAVNNVINLNYTINSTLFSLDGPNEKISITNATNPYFFTDIAGAQFVLGDFFGAKLTGAAYLEINTSGAANFASIRSAAAGAPYYFYIDILNEYYTIGNSASVTNASYFELDATNHESAIYFNNNLALYLDGVNNQYQIGDVNGIHNNNYFEILDSANQFNFFHGATNWLQITANGLDTGSGVPWKFAGLEPGPVSFDTANYLDVVVGGTAYKVALAV